LRLRKEFSRFLAAREGAFIVMAALVLMVLLGIVGLAIDSARATLVRNDVQAAADAAALAAGTTYREVFERNNGQNPDAALQAARETAERFFLANLRPGLLEAAPENILDTFNFEQLPSGELQITYAAPVTLTFGRFTRDAEDENKDTITPSVVSRVSLNTGTSTERLPLELVFVVDSSFSMTFCTKVGGQVETGSGNCNFVYLVNDQKKVYPVKGLSTQNALFQSLNKGINVIFDGKDDQDKLSTKIITYSNQVVSSREFTSSRDVLKSHLLGYQANGDTNILSPVIQATQDLTDYVSPIAQENGQQVIEVIVLMSDGRHNIVQPPMTKIDPNLPIQPVVNACRDFLTNAPQNVRREVFTVYFKNEDKQSSNQQAVQLMTDCASKPEYAFTADNQAQLDAAYLEISQEIQRIRVFGNPQLTF
jgi:Flp pilus assembly protein TadG